MSCTHLSSSTPEGVADLVACYCAELEDIKLDREMAARFHPITTTAWLAQLDREEHAVHDALSRLPRSA